MALKFKAPRGTRDLYGGEMARFSEIEAAARDLFRHYGYSELRLPIFESRELFERSVGQETEIVRKEMYVFPDSKGREYALRPEATASVVRAYIENNLGPASGGGPVKQYYMGPMFRHERPQAGRYRQFYQVGAELLNAGSIAADLEMVDLAMRFLSRLAIEASLRINHLGCAECKRKLSAGIAANLESEREKLCPDCRERLARNPVRILDCKVPGCRELVRAAAPIELCGQCSGELSLYEKGLSRLDIPFTRDTTLVRGLDYYTGIVFEATSAGLGAQDAVLGGGRYDGLVEQLGGAPTPAVGFAAGIDRLSAVLAGSREIGRDRPLAYIVAIGDSARPAASRLAQMLRRAQEDCARRLNARPAWIEQDLQDRSLKSALKAADRLQASYAILVGERELEAGSVLLREMSTGNQTELPFSDRISREEFEKSFEEAVVRFTSTKTEL